MAGTPGIAAKVFAALAGAGVNVRAIAQGSSERNISVVIDEQPDHPRACGRARRPSTCRRTRVSIGVVGPGVVGATLLEQMWSQVPRLLARLQPRPARARHDDVAADAAGRSGRDRQPRGRPTSPAAPPVDLAAFEEHVNAEHIPHAVIIDCSASADVARALSALAGGRHSRRHAQQARQQRSAGAVRRSIHAAGAAAGAHYLYEATVGAGLPIIQTLRDLRETGDEIRAGGGHLLRHAGLSVQRLGRHAAVLRRSCATPRPRATPSPTRATTCPAPTWPASW